MNDKARIVIFKNTYKAKEGDKFPPSDFNGTINLPEGLPAGDYSVGIYENESKKGLKYMSGNIRPAKPKTIPIIDMVKISN